MKAPTQEQVRVYINEGHGHNCPFCGSDQISGGDTDQEAGCITQEVWCNDCQAEWVDEYELVGVTVRDGKTTRRTDVPNEAVELAKELLAVDVDHNCPLCSKDAWGMEKHDESCVFNRAYVILKNANQLPE